MFMLLSSLTVIITCLCLLTGVRIDRSWPASSGFSLPKNDSSWISLNNGARWIFTSFSLVIMALMLGNRFETSHYASWSSYECGLFQKTVARVKYEITFYTVALTFLIFELELLFIFPLLLSLQVSHKSF